MPRAPQSSALLAGRPRAKRVGVVDENVADAVDALSRPMSTRLTRGTGCAVVVGAPDEGVGGLEIGRLGGGFGGQSVRAPRRRGFIRAMKEKSSMAAALPQSRVPREPPCKKAYRGAISVATSRALNPAHGDGLTWLRDWRALR